MFNFLVQSNAARMYHLAYAALPNLKVFTQAEHAGRCDQ